MKLGKEDSFADICSKLNVGYSHAFALELEKFKSHAELGFRTAGSAAEIGAGQHIYNEMLNIGLVAERDEITVDGWEFSKANLYFDDNGTQRTIMLGAYQTNFVTNGAVSYELIFAGRGTAADFDKVDVKGKIAIVLINQRDEWWINYPALQANKRGAVAVIAVQNLGFGELNSSALNAQDICGPEYAPAFSMSKKDYKRLSGLIAKSEGSITVKLDICSKVTKNAKTYNIIGQLKGKTDNVIMVSAHYDSYFKGFQDDNTGISMLLSIASALIKSGYQSQNTLMFCAFAAEEWGTVDSRYDWSAGAYAFLEQSRSYLKGKIIADINLELPAFSHGAKHYIRCVYEYKSFVKKFIEGLSPLVKALYPKGVAVISPVQTWSDDFALATAGVPSMVNEFKKSSFIETHYHSQFDSDDFYNEKTYYFHHHLYTRVLLAMDNIIVAPLNFTTRFKAMEEAFTYEGLDIEDNAAFIKILTRVQNSSKRLFRRIKRVNAKKETADATVISAALLKLFKVCEKKFVALDWYEKALFPFENCQKNLSLLRRAAVMIKSGNRGEALKSLVEIDDNSYAEVFDREVINHFTSSALLSDKARLKWGYLKLKHSGHIDLFDVLRSVKGGDNKALNGAYEKLLEIIDKEQQHMRKIIKVQTKDLGEVSEQLNSISKLFNREKA